MLNTSDATFRPSDATFRPTEDTSSETFGRVKKPAEGRRVTVVRCSPSGRWTTSEKRKFELSETTFRQFHDVSEDFKMQIGMIGALYPTSGSCRSSIIINTNMTKQNLLEASNKIAYTNKYY